MYISGGSKITNPPDKFLNNVYRVRLVAYTQFLIYARSRDPAAIVKIFNELF